MKCPHCKNPIIDTTLFCLECKKVLPIYKSLGTNYFSWFHLKQSFNISVVELEEILIQKLKLLHPDRFTSATDLEKKISTENSALYNHAYAQLTSPVKRAVYLLKLNNFDMTKADSERLDSSFTLEVFDWRERLDGLQTIAECRGYMDDFKKMEIDKIQEIDDLIKNHDYAGVYKCCIRLRFLNRFQNEIIERIRNLL